MWFPHISGKGHTVHIGNARGRIAVWLDEEEAIDMAEHYGSRDLFSEELMWAVEKVYPKEEEE